MMDDNIGWKTIWHGRRHSTEDDLRDTFQWKAAINGRLPRIEDVLLWKTTFNGRQPLIKDKLKWKMTFHSI